MAVKIEQPKPVLGHQLAAMFGMIEVVAVVSVKFGENMNEFILRMQSHCFFVTLG